MAKKANECVALFEAKGAADVYSALVARLQARVGASLAFEDLKQTCVHINAGKDGTAYAGVHPRKGAVLLNIRTQSPLKSKRVRKVEQVSRNRCHCEILLEKVADVDGQVIDWLEQAAGLVADPSKPAASTSKR